MNKNKRILRSSAPALVLALGVVPAAAQFDQTINVEGKYTPQIIRLDRINTFPRQERFPLETAPLPYDAAGLVTPFSPTLSSMPATGWRASRTPFASRGYVDLEAGSWLDASLSAGYRFLDMDATKAGIRLQHNSTSLWKPWGVLYDPDFKRFRYDEALGAWITHSVDGKGTLDASLDYHLGYFNYYGSEGVKGIPTQTLNDVSARVGWTSLSKPDDISWNASAAVRYYGMRRFTAVSWNTPLPSNDPLVDLYTGTRETHVALNGGVLFPTAEKSGVGIDLSANVLAYGGGRYLGGDIPSGDYPAGDTDYEGEDIETLSTMGLVSLTPYYRLSTGNLNLRLGAVVDITANAGPKNDRYGAFHLAPDVRLDYNAGPVGLYVKAGGGTRLHTLASTAMLDYYASPLLTNTSPTHTPLDAALGVSFGPFSGFSAGLDIAFRWTRGEYLEGWYMAGMRKMWMASADPDLYLLGGIVQESRLNTHGYSVGLRLGYDAGKIFSIKGNVSYQPQKDEKSYFNGLDRPRWVGHVEAETNPWNTLRLGLAYDYRGVRNILGTAYVDGGAGYGLPVLISHHLPDVTNLSFNASYAFNSRFSVRVGADNLLNRKIDWLPAQPLPGVTFTAGLSYIFD
ncbi:MAG: TonB-dependent receptor [Muribaculaceae bacterium]|nr:TonB-dependent receptor [Muribaculaceae bacterium]